MNPDFSQTLKVLIVDGSLPSSNELKNTLQALGIKDIELTKSGIEAAILIQKNTENPFDLIFSNWTLEGMTGVELLKFVRANEKFKNTPFVIATSESQKEIVTEAIKEGVDDYMIKPIKIEEVRERIGKTIGRRLSVFITQLTNFANGAELSLETGLKDEEKEKRILQIFADKMSLIRDCAKRLKLPHISYISALSEELAKTALKHPAKRIRKVISTLWDSITTIQVLFEKPNSQNFEENRIIINRLEKTLSNLGKNNSGLSAEQAEAIVFEQMVKDLIKDKK
jgi:two-component system chemotaxis response regulator CheY